MEPTVDVKNEIRISVIVFAVFGFIALLLALIAPPFSPVIAGFGGLAISERLYRIALRANSRQSQFFAAVLFIAIWVAIFVHTFQVAA